MSSKEPLKIVGADTVDSTDLVVEYSNNTTAVYTAEQLSGIEPKQVETAEPDEALPSDGD